VAARFNDRMTDVIDFYDRHPISEAQVLAAVRRRRGRLAEAPLTADDLFDFDQDHYGGLAAVDALARLAGVHARARVLDLCAGLGGPARFLASRRGCAVVAVELNAGRALGAARLTRLVRLHTRVRVVRGDATTLPFGDALFDACLSQEALLHIEDKALVLAECWRVLVRGGRLAFTDWIARPRLADRERARLREWMAATTLQTLEGYRTLLGRAGFTGISAEDITDEWRPQLRHRLQVHRALRQATAARFGERWSRDFLELDRFFVGLVEGGKLGGGRFTASR
jgi:ubiquinone/menaquinone biosynthesis C-methylase UbiE